MSELTNKQFHTDLETTRSLFLEMGGLVESMVRDAMGAVATGDMLLVDRVQEREKAVNRLEVEIDERIVLLIARNQPTAGDLRLLLSIAKMLTDLERCGDEAEKIAKNARRLYEASQPRYQPVVELSHMTSYVIGMVRDSLDAFARQDAMQAAAVVRKDKEVDREWKGALRHISTYMIEDPRTISNSIEFVFIARALERIGDHAKNVAERIIYLVHGDDIRHTGIKNKERAARGEGPVQTLTSPEPLPETADKAVED